MHKRIKSEDGNILATSLLVMLAMNLLAITLVQTSTRQFQSADFKVIDSSIFYLAESCIDNSVNWFKTFSSPPTTELPYTITKTNISNMYSGTESQQMLNEMAKYSYNCQATALTTKSVEASDKGTGGDISSKDSYGLSGDLKPKYYYQIDSNGLGPQNSQKKLVAIISVEY